MKKMIIDIFTKMGYTFDENKPKGANVIDHNLHEKITIYGIEKKTDDYNIEIRLLVYKNKNNDTKPLYEIDITAGMHIISTPMAFHSGILIFEYPCFDLEDGLFTLLHVIDIYAYEQKVEIERRCLYKNVDETYKMFFDSNITKTTILVDSHDDNLKLLDSFTDRGYKVKETPITKERSNCGAGSPTHFRCGHIGKIFNEHETKMDLFVVNTNRLAKEYGEYYKYGNPYDAIIASIDSYTKSPHNDDIRFDAVIIWNNFRNGINVFLNTIEMLIEKQQIEIMKHSVNKK